MEMVLFGYFFCAPAPAKIQTVKTQEDEKGKVWSWYKTSEVNTSV